jgi:hypothetical protein
LGTSSGEELEQKVIQVGNSTANTDSSMFSGSFQTTTHPFAFRPRKSPGFPINVLGIKTGNREKDREKRGNSRNFLERYGHTLIVTLNI